MSNFTVSARKYRPGTFETVVGQNHVTQTLKNAIKKDHIGHAFLFCGPRGVGKTTCARILAKALNCENLTADGEPCGTCNACQSFAKQQSFNIYELDAASNNSVDDIRSLVEQVRFAPQSGKYKIYIIDEVHMLSQAAFNAFLKTLEEPPAYAIFILATTEKHKILPTILSRCQVFDFHRIGIKSAIAHLKDICQQENIKAEEEGLYVIAQKADGALRDALSIFDRVVSFSGDSLSYADVIENLNVLDYEYYFKVIDMALSNDIAGSMLLFDEILSKGFDPHNFLNGLSEHLRNLLICKDPSTIKLMELSEGTQNMYLAQSKKASMSFLLSGLNILNQFDINFKSSKNQRLHVELALMKLCHISDALQFATNGSESAEKKKSDSNISIQVEAPATVAAAPDLRREAQPAVNTAPASATATAPTAAATVAAAKASAPANGGGFSLKLDKIKETLKAKAAEIRSESVVEEQSVDYAKADIDRFKEAWLGYSQNLKTRNKINMGVVAEKIEPALLEDGSVLIKVSNDGLRTLFLDDKQQLADLLVNQYNMPPVKIEYIFVAPTEEETRRYIVSDQDKFRRMAEINPAILDMQKVLGLRV
jgi:DNA polymerase-3 subunit gamma/tau